MGLPSGSVVKNPPVKQKMWVRSLGQEDPLEKEMATYSHIISWGVPGTEEPSRATVHGFAKSWTQLGDYTTANSEAGEAPPSQC